MICPRTNSRSPIFPYTVVGIFGALVLSQYYFLTLKTNARRTTERSHSAEECVMKQLNALASLRQLRRFAATRNITMDHREENGPYSMEFARGYLRWKLADHGRPSVPAEKAVLWQAFLSHAKEHRSHVTIVSGTVGDDGSPIASISRHSLRFYARRHGYRLLYFGENVDSSIDEPHWQKLAFIREAMADPVSDVIVWIDHDVVITNFHFRLENFLHLTPDDGARIEFVISADMAVNDADMLFNTGVMVLRNSAKMRAFIGDWILSRSQLAHYRYARYHEQSTLNAVFYNNAWLQAHTLRLPLCILQSTHSVWRPRDFILHVAGLDRNETFMQMDKIINYGYSINEDQLSCNRELIKAIQEYN